MRAVSRPTITRFSPLTDLPEVLRVGEVARYLDCGETSVYQFISRTQVSSSASASSVVN
jgi:hypothetical protein